jgi:protein-S-isoprenylcysteine O-methyltransferase Ste14
MFIDRGAKPGMMSFFDYFQIASVALFLLTIVGKTAYLRKVRNINPIVIGGGKKGFLLAVEVMGFSCLVVWMVEVLLYALHSGFRILPSPLDMQLIDSVTAKLVGASLVTLGLLIFNLAYVSFGDSWRVGFDVKTPGKLVTRGIFNVSRNPIYLSINLWIFGIFLINGTLIFLLFALLAIAVQHWQILQEEDFLSRLYGQPYQDYRARTPRYVIW